MSRILTVILWLGSVSWALGQTDPESVEPALEYSLHVNDQVVRLTPGSATKLKGTFNNPTVKLVPDEFRTFPYAGVSFRYPSNFAFESDLTDETVRTWSLDGANCVIMIQHYAVAIEAADLASSLVDQYGEANARISDVSITLAGKKIAGKRVTAKVATSQIMQDVFRVPSAKGTTLMLLQHSPNDDGSAPDERKLLEKQLTESFAVKKPAD